MSRQIAVIGECMIEVKPKGAGDKYSGPTMAAKICYGGDTLNCSVYMSRLGVNVSYVTALGDDPMSDWMLRQWAEEGIQCDLVSRVVNAVPGLYLIDIDDAGERSFSYWRDQAPARRIFDTRESAEALFAQLKQFQYLYLSGITLALYDEAVRYKLFDFLDDYRQGGGKVLFDNNYRPKQWRSNDEAQTVFEQMYRRCDIALPTIDDEILIYGDASEADIIARLQSWGVAEIALKKGASGCVVAHGAVIEQVDAMPIEHVVDTTAAGDSFNAGYLAARFKGNDSATAARHGNKLAATVVQHPGAIIPRSAM